VAVWDVVLRVGWGNWWCFWRALGLWGVAWGLGGVWGGKGRGAVRCGVLRGLSVRAGMVVVRGFWFVVLVWYVRVLGFLWGVQWLGGFGGVRGVLFCFGVGVGGLGSFGFSRAIHGVGVLGFVCD